jgi:heme oxygenase
MAGLAQPLLYRSAHITADLDMLVGSNWLAALPLLPSGEAYATRVAWAAGGDGAMLIAHAYTRYLGDLNGGQILGRRLLRQFGPDFRATAFTEFPAIDDIRAFAAAYRAALNHAGAQLPDAEGVVQEAELAFEMNIQLSHDVDMRR